MENVKKNTAAINKIITELSMKDYLSMNPIKNGKKLYKNHRPYSLSDETLEAVEVLNQYLTNVISEEEYKTFCLRYNLRTVNQ